MTTEPLNGHFSSESLSPFMRCTKSETCVPLPWETPPGTSCSHSHWCKMPWKTYNRESLITDYCPPTPQNAVLISLPLSFIPLYLSIVMEDEFTGWLQKSGSFLRELLITVLSVHILPSLVGMSHTPFCSDTMRSAKFSVKLLLRKILNIAHVHYVVL